MHLFTQRIAQLYVRLSKNCIRQDRGQPAIARIIQERAIHRVTLAIRVPTRRRRKGVHKQNLILRSHLRRGRHVQL